MPSAPIRPPELSELEALVLALEDGSIARAATRLQISAPAAAKRIRRLETLAGCELLTRGARGVTATETGARLYPIAREMLAQRTRLMQAAAGPPAPDPLRIDGLRRLLGGGAVPPAEERLRDTETVLARIFHATGDAMVLTDPDDGLILELNDAAAKMLGWDAERVRRASLADPAWEEQRERRQLVARALESGAPEHGRLVLRTRGGARRLVAVRCELIALPGGAALLETWRPSHTAIDRTEPAAGEDGAHPGELERATEFLTALRTADRDRALAAAQAALDAGLDVAAVHGDLIQPAMRTIGDLWERGAVSVADEHLATQISHEVASRIFWQGICAVPRSRERVILAAVAGEHHVLGLRLIADLLEGAGYDTLCLGADVPPEALLDACRLHQPDLLGLSVGLSANVPELLRQVRDLSELDSMPSLMVGGRAAPEAVSHGLRAPLVTHAGQVLAVVEKVCAARALR